MMKSESELISVIVPVYNVEPYMERCIDSIINQSYENLEIILVDDGSTDKSGEICDAYEKIDTRVRVFHKRNGGLSSARNSGLEIASGKYIGFVDSDDYIAPDMYEALYRHMSDDVDFVCCGIVRIDRKGHRTMTGHASGKAVCMDNVQAVKELLLRRYLAFSACDKLCRKEVIREIGFPDDRVCEDLPYTYRLVKRCRKVVNIGSCKYYYCYRSDSISRTPFYGRRIDYVLFARDILRDVRNCYPLLRKEAEYLYVVNIMSMIDSINESPNKGDYKSMRKRMVKAVKRMLLLIILNPVISNGMKVECIKLR